MSYIVPVTTGINTDHIDWLVDKKTDLSAETAAAEDGSFKAILNGVIDNVVTTENQTKINAYNLSIGNMDDMHTMMIDSFKAEAALQTMIQLRNKMLDAYKEIININL